jgi:hypothetical protein
MDGKWLTRELLALSTAPGPFATIVIRLCGTVQEGSETAWCATVAQQGAPHRGARPHDVLGMWSLILRAREGGREMEDALPGHAHDLTAARTHRISRICERQGVPVSPTALTSAPARG